MEKEAALKFIEESGHCWDQLLSQNLNTNYVTQCIVEVIKALIYRGWNSVIVYKCCWGNITKSNLWRAIIFGGYSDHLATYFRLIVTK